MILENMHDNLGVHRSLAPTAEAPELWAQVESVFPFVKKESYTSIGVQDNVLLGENVATAVAKVVPASYKDAGYVVWERKFFLQSNTIGDKTWRLVRDDVLPELPTNIELIAIGHMLAVQGWELPDKIKELKPSDVYFISDATDDVCAFFGVASKKEDGETSHFGVTFHTDTGEFYRFKEYCYPEGSMFSPWKYWKDSVESMDA